MELDQTSTPDTMVRVAASNLADRFTTVDRERIEATVRRQVEQRYAHARVTNFVGILAEREARAELEREATANPDREVRHAPAERVPIRS